ncbi:DUF6286 domain-containing protein [Streptomyces botrytidirepellens]|uniref:DUF6286 domain-containing protein n=1 Tax=Streptomyces botrytidirepellens TaxID=2486417 RepID=A0A3M8WNG0_9ACTN|nr:DUF6286 domain-containing protein [Streptomyces botrytidirepellens]RNG30499.1 hypothetical protein EEJ42_10300 [Streptomyces botrytidirepellens]
MNGLGRPGRFWSARRVPAGLTALVLLGALGLLLYDIVSERTGHPVMEWRRWLAEQLATRPLHDGWIVGIAVALIVIGAWMVALALTPGLRGLLPMGHDENDADAIRAGIDRTAVRLVLRDRAMAVPGVRAVRVDVGRRRIRARAQAHFRDLDEVRADLLTALGDGIRQLGLARRPGLSVRVRRPAR